jgi:predicted metal-dependent peptidase
MKASGRIKKKKRGAGQGSGQGSKSNSTPDSDKSDDKELDNSDEDNDSDGEADNDSDDDASDDEKSDSEEKEDEESEDGEKKEGEEKDSDAAAGGGKGKSKSKKVGKGKGASQKSGNKGKSSKQKNNGSAPGGTGVSDEEKTFNKPSLEDLIASVKANTKKLKEKYELPQNNIQAKIKVEIESDKDVVFDDHTFWQGDDEDKVNSSMWNDRIMRATDVVLEKEKSHVGFGGPPLCAVRLVKELREPAVDWRTLLNDFIQEEVNDYSFSPPDRRMDDSPFFLPDFNVKEESIKNVWFLIDTSGSIGDKQIAAAYSEIISAIEMFDGKMEGMLSFTEVFVTDPIPFCSAEELLKIKPVGGGGNDFSEIFRYMQRNMTDELPTSIVILTDGYDYYPDESEALGVPVFWLINNDNAKEPPWGKWARFKVNDNAPE